MSQVEEEQSQQRELALEKDKMATAFDNLKNLVEEDADTEAEYVKVRRCTPRLSVYGRPVTKRVWNVRCC